ncbi:hypothetical protein [Thauera sp.]|uniref:hypothetical protein n=1 Tax=Thauera sp. TaxID=1905334 RepID=UPI0039E44263
MSISREPLVEVVRAWEGEPGRSARRGCLVVTWEFHDTVVLSAATGVLTRADLRALGAELLAAGVRTIRAWRCNGQRLPGGRCVLPGETHSLWEIDLPALMARSAR